VFEEAVEVAAVLQDLDAVAGVDRSLGEADERRLHVLDAAVAGELEVRLDAPPVRRPEEKEQAADQRHVPIPAPLRAGGGPGPRASSPSQSSAPAARRRR